MVSSNKYIIQDTYSCEGCFDLHLLDLGIVVIEFDDEFYHLKIEHVIEIEEGMRYLGKGKKLPFYFDSKDFMSVDEEAIAYTKSDESGKFTLANAVYVDNSAKRLLYQFYFRLKKPKTPTKVFGKKEDAFKWLRSLIDQ